MKSINSLLYYKMEHTWRVFARAACVREYGVCRAYLLFNMVYEYCVGANISNDTIILRYSCLTTGLCDMN